jgi:hypothetical protein
MDEMNLEDLRAELEEFAQPEPSGGKSARELRIIAGFEEIERFVEEHGRLPQHGEDRDIFERLYAVRLDRLRASPECRAVLADRDPRGLLGVNPNTGETGVVREEGAVFGGESPLVDEPSEDEILRALREGDGMKRDITQLSHVRSREEIRAAEEVAKRTPCVDFENFRPTFESVQQDLATGKRQTVKFKDNAEVKRGDLFILDGQKLVVADMGEPFVSEYDRPDRRLRVVYDNGTESDLLLRSLQRALNKDKASRRITEPNLGPLFSTEDFSGDHLSGHIYILRSQSEHPFIAENRSVIHKIGVTTGDVKTRVANAKKDPTYLFADVEVVATYKLSQVDPQKLEALLHRFFSAARLNLKMDDRFGFAVEPREWFLVALPVVEEVIQKIIEGTIGQFRYDAASAALVRVEPSA